MQPISMTIKVDYLINFPFTSLECVIAHPVEPLLFIAGGHGFLQVWNHETKKVILSKIMQVQDTSKLAKKNDAPSFIITPITSLVLNSTGTLLGIIFNN